ncbi:MAG: proton-conducting transporter membrane subunit, partial [Pseudomonadota bacterium]
MLQDVTVLLPELLLAMFIAVAWGAGRVSGEDAMASRVLWLSVGVFAILAIWLVNRGGMTQLAFSGAFIDDPLARYGKVMCLGGAAFILAMSRDVMYRRDMLRLEYPVLVGVSQLGMMTMVSAGDLSVLILATEAAAFAFYALVALRRQSSKAGQAALKLVLLGCLFSVVTLFGLSLLFGATGTTRIARLTIDTAGWDVQLGLVLVIAGLGFKLAAAPFHFWAADVQEGAPIAIAALLLTVVPLAVLIVLARLLQAGLPEIAPLWQAGLALLSVLSVLVGALALTHQAHIKRFLAFAGVLNTGYVLAGLSAANGDGLLSALLQASTFSICAIGLFAFVLSMEREERPIFEIEALRGYARYAPRRGLA